MRRRELGGGLQRKSDRTYSSGHMLAQTRPLNFLSIIPSIYPPLRHIWVQVACEHAAAVSVTALMARVVPADETGKHTRRSLTRPLYLPFTRRRRRQRTAPRRPGPPRAPARSQSPGPHRTDQTERAPAGVDTHRDTHTNTRTLTHKRTLTHTH